MGLVIKRLQILSLGDSDKIRNHLVANPILYYAIYLKGNLSKFLRQSLFEMFRDYC